MTHWPYIHFGWVFFAAFAAFVVGMVLMALMADAKARDKSRERKERGKIYKAIAILGLGSGFAVTLLGVLGIIPLNLALLGQLVVGVGTVVFMIVARWLAASRD